MLRLRVLTGPRAGRQIRVSDTETVTIGRKSGRVRLHDSRVSKEHAAIDFVEGAWVLRDLGSSNGSIVNKNILRGLAELETGDVLQFGRVLVKVQQADATNMDDQSPPVVNLAVDAPAKDAPAKKPPKPEAFADSDDDEDLDLDAIFAEHGDGSTDQSENIELDSTTESTEQKADSSDASGIAMAKAADNEDEDEDEQPAQPAVAQAPPAKPKAKPKPDDDDQYDLVLDLDDQESSTSAWDDINPSDDSSILDVPSPAADVEEQGQDKPEQPTDVSQGSTVGAESDDQASDESAEGEQDDDADLIQIEDDTPDTNRPAGSTIVLPDTGVQPAVGSSDSGLAATPEEMSTVETAADEDERDAVSVWDQAQAHADDEDGDDSERRVADEEAHAEQDKTAGQTEADQAPATLPADASSPDDEPLADADRPDEDDEKQAQQAAEVETEAEAESEVAEVAEDSEDAPLSQAEAEAEVELAPAIDLAEPDVDSEQDDAAAPVVAEADAKADAHADAKDVELNLEDDEPTEEHAESSQSLNTFADPELDLDSSEDDGPAIGSEGPSEPQIDEPPRDFELDDTPEPIASDDIAKLDLDDEQDTEDSPAVATVTDELSEDDPDEFDIDAAFAELAQGLDDEDEDDSPPSASTSADSSKDADDDKSSPENIAKSGKGLTGSQLDVDYIQKALADLPQVDDDRHPLGLQSPKNQSSAEAFDTDASQDEQADPPEIKAFDLDAPDDAEGSDQPPAAPPQRRTPLQTPPGVNPTSTFDSVEPKSSSRSRGAKPGGFQRFLPAGIVLLLVGGLFGYMIANPSLITGKEQDVNTPSPYENPTPPPPREDDQDGDAQPAPQQSTPNEDDSPVFGLLTPGNNQQPTPPTHDQENDPSTAEPDPTDTDLGSAAPPDPFSAGPPVLGPIAVRDRLAGPNASAIPRQVTDPTASDGPLVTPGLPSTTRPTPGQNTDEPGGDATGEAEDKDNPAENTDAPAIPADGDRLVFLVDASGSMVDSFPQMLAWLQEALTNLEPQERFTIIFFQRGKAIEVDPAGLHPMTQVLRQTLREQWLSPNTVPILPAGRSTPIPALELALSYNPSDIYLLSDASFAKATGDTTRDQAVTSITETLGDAEVRLHGVQFFYQDNQEAGTLQTLASQTDGTYEFVAEARQPNQDPINLLQELENRND